MIEHVEIADVSQYEAAQQAATGAATTSQSPTEVTSEATTPTADAASGTETTVAEPQVTITDMTYGTGSDTAVAARALSATVNYRINRAAVFRACGGSRQVVRYLGLALVVLGASYLGLRLLTHAGVPLIAAKVLTDVVLYLVSFVVQREFVFAARSEHGEHGDHKVRAGGEGAQVPRSEAQLFDQAGGGDISLQGFDLVPPAEPKAEHETAARGEVTPERAQCLHVRPLR